MRNGAPPADLFVPTLARFPEGRELPGIMAEPDLRIRGEIAEASDGPQIAGAIEQPTWQRFGAGKILRAIERVRSQDNSAGLRQRDGEAQHTEGMAAAEVENPHFGMEVAIRS